MSDEQPLVLRSDRDGLCTITLNRPGKLNALTPGVFVALREILAAVAADDSVHCVVLQGAGRSFCAGHDLAAIADGERAPSRHFEPETVDVLERLPQPTIARVHGHCFTGGLELALGCDLIVTSSTARFGDTHGQWGLVPIWGMSVRLPERVGRAMAKQLMFTSRRIDGVEAQRIGLADVVVAEEELDATVEALAREILTNSPGTNRRVKLLIADADDLTRTAALERERTLPHGVPEDMAARMSRG